MPKRTTNQELRAQIISLVSRRRFSCLWKYPRSILIGLSSLIEARKEVRFLITRAVANITKHLTLLQSAISRTVWKLSIQMRLRRAPRQRSYYNSNNNNSNLSNNNNRNRLQRRAHSRDKVFRSRAKAICFLRGWLWRICNHSSKYKHNNNSNRSKR